MADGFGMIGKILGFDTVDAKSAHTPLLCAYVLTDAPCLARRTDYLAANIGKVMLAIKMDSMTGVQ